MVTPSLLNVKPISQAISTGYVNRKEDEEMLTAKSGDRGFYIE
jgi:hypothetical protein